MIDYRAIKATIVGHIKSHTQHEVVLQASNDPQPAYPFCSYTITSPYLPVSRAEQGEDIVEDVEIVFSLTWHSEDATEAQELAHKTAMAFTIRSAIQKLGDSGIAVVRLSGFQNRDTFLTIDSERRVGFDLRIRIRHVETDELGFETIETVETIEIVELP